MGDRIVLKVVLDIFALACVGLACLFITIWAQPYERGYFENDTSIRLPYRNETITETVLGVVGFMFVVITILVVEFTRGRRDKNLNKTFFGNFSIPGWVLGSYTAIGSYGFGAACQQLTTTFTKYVIGRLRPHFYDVCRPIPNVNSPLNTLGYNQDYTCSNVADAALFKNMRLSFPSAHSCFAMYTAVFFICYVQVKGKWRGSKLLRHSIQLAVFLAAWYVGLSRVTDHFHHWEDVCVGFLIGAMYGFLVFIYVMKPKKYDLTSTWEDTAPQNGLPRPVLAR